MLCEVSFWLSRQEQPDQVVLVHLPTASAEVSLETVLDEVMRVFEVPFVRKGVVTPLVHDRSAHHFLSHFCPL